MVLLAKWSKFEVTHPTGIAHRSSPCYTKRCSSTAEYGDVVYGPTVIGDDGAEYVLDKSSERPEQQSSIYVPIRTLDGKALMRGSSSSVYVVSNAQIDLCIRTEITVMACFTCFGLIGLLSYRVTAMFNYLTSSTEHAIAGNNLSGYSYGRIPSVDFSTFIPFMWNSLYSLIFVYPFVEENIFSHASCVRVATALAAILGVALNAVCWGYALWFAQLWVRHRWQRAKTISSIVLSLVLLVILRVVIDPTHAFVHSFYPVHLGNRFGVETDSFNRTSDIGIMDSVVTAEWCDKVVESAEEYAHRHHWTTDRHAQYPTTDIPLQVLPDIYQEFMVLFYTKISSGMAQQYGRRWGWGTILRYEIVPMPWHNCVVGSPMDFFVVKYSAEAGKQKSLRVHVDGGHWSFIVSLNQHGHNFAGGGTRYHPTKTREEHQAELKEQDEVDLLSLEPRAECSAGEKCSADLNSSSIQQDTPKNNTSRIIHLVANKGDMVYAPARVYHEGVATLSGTRYILTGFTQVDTTCNDLLWWIISYIFARSLVESATPIA